MIDCRVDNLAEELEEQEIAILENVETYSHGKFAYITDLKGYKVQLWDPAP